MVTALGDYLILFINGTKNIVGIQYKLDNNIVYVSNIDMAGMSLFIFCNSSLAFR